MKLSKGEQKDILLGSFEILKDNYEENYSELSEIIGKMAIIDIDIAMDMWEHVFASNPDLIVRHTCFTNEYHPLTTYILDEILRTAELGQVADAIASRLKIKNVIFNKSGDIGWSHCSVIAEYISKGKTETANDILQLIATNKNNTGKGGSLKLSGALIRVIEELGRDVDENIVDFIHYWIQQINDPQEKAKANVKFLNFFSGE